MMNIITTMIGDRPIMTAATTLAASNATVTIVRVLAEASASQLAGIDPLTKVERRPFSFQ